MIRTLRGLCVQFVVPALLVGTVSAYQTELRLVTPSPPGSPQMGVLERSAQDIKERTAGRVTVRYFPVSQQGDERDVVRKINLGQLDGAELGIVGLTMIDESIRVLSLPLLFSSDAEADYVAERLWPYLQRRFEKKGFRLAGRGEAGWTHLFSRTKIETRTDLVSQKLGLSGDDQLTGTLFRKLALPLVLLGVPEMDSSLIAGRITACYGTPLETVALQWYSKVRFMTAQPLSYGVRATVIALNSLRKLAVEDQKVVMTIDNVGQKKLRTVMRKANDDARNAMMQRGIAMVPMAPPLMAEFNVRAGELQREMSGKLSPMQEEVAMAIHFRDEYRLRRGGK